MYSPVTKAIPSDDYVLFVEFENGESGSLDLKPFLEFGIFRRIKDPDAFKKVRVAFDTVEWECGADLDPEYVYAKCRRSRSA
ncbi:MAG: DUF2442 domain-containing protein [Candidatus Eremiobacteraeota bacterium]|nr:DUF2442 domain-containing protein [Candidatus Eremiobacteraeota bacterium]